MTKRNLSGRLGVVGIVAFCGTVSALQIIDDRRDRHAAFDRGYAAATCDLTLAVYPEPHTRPPEMVEVITLCESWDGRLKP